MEKDALVKAIADMEEEQAIKLTQQMLDAGTDPELILDAAKEGMDVVGDRYEQKEYFLPELIIAGDLLKAISNLVKPKLQARVEGKVQGKVVIGTVAGDIHDIGKDVVSFMLDVNNFQVHDLGVDVAPDVFVGKIKEIQPEIVGLSGFLTLAFDQMKRTVDAIEAAGLRQDVKIMIGGAIMDANVAKYVGADAYGPDASAAVKLAKGWLAQFPTGGRRTTTMSEKSPQELYDERIKRALDVAALRVPDRVPVFGPYQKYPYAFAGVTLKEAMNDYACARAACHKFLDYFQPDVDFGPIFAYPAKPMETLGWKAFKWPGHGLADDIMYQYVDDEYLKADEYDDFISDPSDFMLRTWAPRQFKALEGFSQFVPWRRFMWTGWMNAGFFASPEMREALRLAMQAGEEMNEWWGSQVQYWGEIKDKGYPLGFAGWDWPPFDILGDTLRGTHQVLADMRRRPEKLHDALEVTTKIFIEYGSGAAGAPLPFCWVWVHKATREFMSDAQFKEFYWPYLRKGMLALVEKGVTPVIYWEANFESRLEHIVDVPKGKIIYHLSNTNAQKAKAVLGDTVCLMGNVPNIMLLSGTPDDVRAYCKNLIDTVGKDGGFIMDAAVMLDEARPENLKAMMDFTKEYGVY